MRRSWWLELVAGCLVLGSAASARSQQPAGEQKAPPTAGAIVDHAPSAPVGVMTPQENDRRIARWLDVDNKSIIECSQQVQDRSTNDKVKEFARTVVADHQLMQSKLRAPEATGETNAVRSNDGAVLSAQIVRDDGASRDGKMVFRPVDFVAVKEKVCDSLRADAKKHFDKLSAEEFDRAYVVHMTMAHEALVASIDAVEGSASAALQPHLRELKDMSQRHLDHLKQMKDHFPTQTTAGRPATTDVK